MNGLAPPLLSIRNLGVAFGADGDRLYAVDGVDLDIAPGDTLGLVGESGSGKSVTALAIMRLLPPASARLSGSVQFEGRDLLGIEESAMRGVRGSQIAMVYQEPMTALNPVHRIGRQIAEALTTHGAADSAAAAAQAVALLRDAGIALPEMRARDYPHQLSGGMRQRAMIAMALACKPKLLIADEPTTALDVTIQAQILALIADLKARTSMAVLLITHDLGVVAESCDRVAVMYAGRIVEEADVFALFEAPRHPYTHGLIASIPRLDLDRDVLPSIPGTVPNPRERAGGCAFAPRCALAIDHCRSAAPPLVAHGHGRRVACWRPGEMP